MNILAMDTSQKTVSVALLADETILVDTFINRGINHSAVLLPAIEKACQMAGLTVDGVDLFALTIGPGSFTGLRIGASTVKGLALATGKPVVGISTLEALAQNGKSSTRLICPLLDAQKNQVYTAYYRVNADGWVERTTEERVMNVEALLRNLNEEVLFLGDGAGIYAELIRKVLRKKAFFAASHQQHVRAGAVGFLGRNKFLNGDLLDILRFTPHYLRPSEAEVRLNMQKV